MWSTESREKRSSDQQRIWALRSLEEKRVILEKAGKTNRERNLKLTPEERSAKFGYWKGKQPSDELRKKWSEAHKGHVTSDTTRKKIKDAQTGKINRGQLALRAFRKGKTHEEIFGIEKATQMRKANIEKHRGKIPWNKGLTKNDPRICAVVERRKEKGNYGHTEKTKAEIRAKALNQWRCMSEDERNVFVRNQKVNAIIKPNKPELFLIGILQSLFPGEYKYVGDYQFTLAGKCPDFVNINGKKKIIELFGDYWHRGKNPQERINLFKQYGYETLVIWERELKDKQKLQEKLNEFHGNKDVF